MNIRLLLLAISAAAITGCNTAYKSGQTPDDVYFSPGRVIEENTKNEIDEDVANTDMEEREIKMKIRDRRWRDLDDDYDYNCSCHYPPNRYGYNYGNYYNPYYNPYIPGRYINPKNTTARMTNLGGYNNVRTTQSVNPKTGRTETIRKERRYNNNNSEPREVFTPSGNNRTYTPSTNSSGNSNSGSGRSISRPPNN